MTSFSRENGRRFRWGARGAGRGGFVALSPLGSPSLTVAACPLVLIAGLCCHPALGRAAADDMVVLAHSAGTGSSRILGEVVERTGAQLVFRHSSGREETIDGSRVVEVRTTWNDATQRADALFDARDYPAALELYREGIAAEQRRWAQRRILARVVWCQRYTGQDEQACRSFLTLYADDSTTHHVDCIPLAWLPVQPAAGLEAAAIDWLGDADRAEARLIAASWLLSTSRRGAAAEALRGIDGADPRLIFLAEGQRWRMESAAASVADLEEWSRRINLMPVPIRAGPYYALAEGWARQARPDAAAWTYLRLPILYARHRALAARSLLAAGQELEKMHQDAEAQSLYREILDRFGETASAAQARQQLATAEAEN